MSNTFKKKYSFEKRSQESNTIKEKYPDRIPIIVQKHNECDLPNVDKCKYLVPKDMLFSQFIFIIRKRINLKPENAIFLTVNGKLITGSTPINRVYGENVNKDGFLYVVYTSENTFG